MENTFSFAPATVGATKPPSVLVVVVVDLLLKYCNRVLDDTAIAIDMAEDGLEALEKVQHNDYEVILLDVAMPHMDGITCLKRLQEGGCDIVVIMVTGRRGRADGGRGSEAGRDPLYPATRHPRQLAQGRGVRQGRSEARRARVAHGARKAERTEVHVGVVLRCEEEV